MAKKVLLRDWNNDEVLPITRGELVLDSSGKEAFRSNDFLATTSQPGLLSAEDKFKIDNIEGIGDVANDKVSQVNTTTSDVYRLLFSETADDETRTEGARKSAKLTFNPSTGVLQTSGLIGNIDGTYVNKLTGYNKATLISDITSEDTLINALGKVELRAEVAYNLIQGAYDGDGTIENLAEILKVLEGISDTETIQAIVGKYLPLSGGSLTGNVAFTNGKYLQYKVDSIEEGTGGWTNNIFTIVDANWSRKAGIGAYGNNSTLNYMYIGSNAYNANNLRIYSNKITFGEALILTEANYYDYALPLSGGTIAATSTRSLTINRENGSNSLIFFKGLSNGTVADFGYLGFGGIDNPIFYSAAGNTYNLIHTGNYADTTDKRYLKLSGGTINGNLTLNATSDAFLQILLNGTSKALVGWQSNHGVRLYNYTSASYLSIKDDGTPTYNGNTLIHSGNIGSYNAGSATKLQDNTAYTAWGQTFFENGKPKNVSGNLTLGYNKIYLANGNDAYYIGWNGNTQLVFNTYYDIIFNTKTVERLRITTNGNILIGTTTDNGYKLDINGTFNATTIYQNGKTLDKYYLSLSGGTISGGHLTLANTARVKMNGGLIELNDGDGTNGVYLGNARNIWGENESKNLCIYDGSWHRAIHSGNYASYALPLTGGTIKNGNAESPLRIDSNASQTYLTIANNSNSKSAFGWIGTQGTFIYSFASNRYLGIKDDGTPHYQGNTLYHTGNLTKVSQLTNDAGYITNYTDTAAGKTFKTLSKVSHIGWQNNTIDDKIIPTMSFMAYWNGAYASSNASNLIYSANGVIIGSSNYTTYTVKKDGTGATGTWGINITGSASITDKVAVVSCRSTSNSKLWDDPVVDSQKVKFWDVYNDGGPSTYGNIIEINGIDGHWKPQLWIDAGTGARVRVRNRNYSATENVWGAWRSLAFVDDIPTITNYYWANVSISATSNSSTSPTFANIITANILPKTNNTYSIGSNGNEYSTGDIRAIYARHIDSARSYTGDSNLYIQYLQKGNTLMQINGGNVGIGTGNPTQKLSVNGAIHTMQPSTNRCAGIIGTYDPNRAAAIWSMGSSYQIAADGLSFGSLYGAAYAYYGSGYTFGAGKSGGHSFVWCQGGTPHVALGNNIWTKGSLIVESSQTLYGLTSTCNAGNDASYTTAAMQIREYNFGGAQDKTWAIAPRLAWHWSGRVQAQIGLGSNGCLYISEDGSFNSPRLILHSGNTYVSSGIGYINGTSITKVSNADNADTLDNYHASSFILKRIKTARPAGTAIGWYRCAQISSSNAGHSQNVIISLQRSYTSPSNEHYIFAISIGYSGQVSINQISGCVGGQRITKIRVVYNNSGKCYFDYYMDTSNYTNTYKVEILAGDCISYQEPTLVSTTDGTAVEFVPISGMKSNYSIYAPSFYQDSDQTLKTNIQTILSSDNMPIIKEFDWKSDGTHSYGLIAQELEEKGYYELVNTDGSGSKTVNYTAALSLIVGKLQNKIKELEKEIENLKNKN